MKKQRHLQLLIALIVFCFSNASLNAQESHLGIKAGWNNTIVDDIPGDWGDFEFDRQNGFHIGGFGEWYLTDNFAIALEALFSGKGTVINFVDSAQVKSESNIRLNYLTFPVLAQYKLGPLFVQAGPEFGFQLNSDISGNSGNHGLLDPDFWDQSFDLSGVAGLGLNIGNLFVAARYGLSFNKLIEVTETDIDGNVDREGTYGQNSFWQLSIGLRLI